MFKERTHVVLHWKRGQSNYAQLAVWQRGRRARRELSQGSMCCGGVTSRCVEFEQFVSSGPRTDGSQPTQVTHYRCYAVQQNERVA